MSDRVTITINDVIKITIITIIMNNIVIRITTILITITINFIIINVKSARQLVNSFLEAVMLVTKHIHNIRDFICVQWGFCSVRHFRQWSCICFDASITASTGANSLAGVYVWFQALLPSRASFHQLAY